MGFENKPSPLPKFPIVFKIGKNCTPNLFGWTMCLDWATCPSSSRPLRIRPSITSGPGGVMLALLGFIVVGLKNCPPPPP